jgi:hypothetical protein
LYWSVDSGIQFGQEFMDFFNIKLGAGNGLFQEIHGKVTYVDYECLPLHQTLLELGLSSEAQRGEFFQLYQLPTQQSDSNTSSLC